MRDKYKDQLQQTVMNISLVPDGGPVHIKSSPQFQRYINGNSILDISEDLVGVLLKEMVKLK